jgi:hypothetical protein
MTCSPVIQDISLSVEISMSTEPRPKWLASHARFKNIAAERGWALD